MLEYYTFNIDKRTSYAIEIFVVRCSIYAEVDNKDLKRICHKVLSNLKFTIEIKYRTKKEEVLKTAIKFDLGFKA